MAQCIPAFTLVPRFILSLRELYARDVQGRRGSNIDTAFGLASVSTHGALTTIMFADGRQNGELEQSEEISLEERSNRSAGSCA